MSGDGPKDKCVFVANSLVIRFPLPRFGLANEVTNLLLQAMIMMVIVMMQ